MKRPCGEAQIVTISQLRHYPHIEDIDIVELMHCLAWRMVTYSHQKNVSRVQTSMIQLLLDAHYDGTFKEVIVQMTIVLMQQSTSHRCPLSVMYNIS